MGLLYNDYQYIVAYSIMSSGSGLYSYFFSLSLYVYCKHISLKKKNKNTAHYY